jgi:hypothetical protein
MSAPRNARRPGDRRARTRGRWAVAAVLALVIAPFAGVSTAAAAPTGTLSEVGLTVTDDGSATLAGLDPASDNGVVATNNAVTMSWALRADSLTDGVLSQTLPEGWSWVTSSLGKLSSNSSLYQSSYAISADGRTLTATISVPGASLVSVSGLQAIPSPTVANGSVYRPELTATDETQTLTATGTDLTVASVPQAVLGMSAIYRFTTTHDFGSGAEAAQRMQMRLQYRADASLVGQVQPLELALPQRLTLSYTGPEPDAITVCDGETELVLVSAGDGTAVVDLTAQPSSGGSYPSLCFWYRSEDLPVGVANGETLTTTVAVPELTTADGRTILRTGGDTASATVYVDEPVNPVVPPRAATLAASAYGFNWSSYPAGPTFPTPWRSGQWRELAESGGHLLSQSEYIPSYDYATSTTVGVEDLIGYQFWDPSTATVLDDPASIFVGRYRTAIDPSTYRVEFTNTRVITDPATANTWYATIDEAGGAAAVSGVRVVYTGGVWAAGSTSGTASQMSLTVPLIARADGVPTQFRATHVWTAAEETPLVKYASIDIRPFSVYTNLSGTPSSVVGGSPVTYTVGTGAAHSIAGPPTAPDYAVTALVTVTLPSTVTSVDVSAATAAGWTLVSETPADLGPDGLPGTSDDGKGIVLVFSRDAVVGATTRADLPSFQLPVMTALHAPASQRMTATAATRFEITSPTPTALSSSASAVTTVLQGETLTMEGATSTPRIAATDDTVSWSTRWYNYSTVGHEAETHILDVLPYDGDARGTSTSGTLTLTGIALLGGAAASGAVVEVTTADPGTIGAAPGDGATWTTLTDDTDLSSVTAVRVALSGLATGADGGFGLTMAVTGHAVDDVFVNSATSASVGSTLTMDTGDVPVEVVGSTISGRVLIDTDRDGLAGSDGEPAVGAAVQLVDIATDTVLMTAVTGTDGAYVLGGVGAGTYRVQVVRTSIAGTSVTPTVDPDEVLDGATEVTVGLQDSVTDLDFAFAVRNPALTLGTVGEAPSGSLAAGDTVTFTSTVTNSGDVELSGLRVQDSLPTGGTWTWPGATGELAVGESATYTVEHVLTQAEVDAGQVSSTVQVAATDDTGEEVTATAAAQVLVPSGGALAVTGDGALPERIAAGERIAWTMTIRNTGAVTLDRIDVTDALAGMSDYQLTWPGRTGTLAPGEEVVATATSALTQAQVDVGTVTARVRAVGTAPDGAQAATSADVPVRFQVPGQVRIDVELNGSHPDRSPGAQLTVGDAIAWTYRVTNTGAATLRAVTVSDDLGTAIGAPDGFSGELAPGESAVFTARTSAAEGTWSPVIRVTATEGDTDRAVVAADTLWYTATAGSDDPGTDTPTDPATDTPSDPGTDTPSDSGTTGTATVPESAATAGVPSSQVLAVTGASAAGVLLLALLALAVGAGLTRTRTLRGGDDRG